MRLYELPAAFAAFDEAMVETGGELTPEMEAEHAGLLGSLVENADLVAAMIQENRRRAESARDEASRLRDLGDRRRHAADRMADLLKAAMVAAGERRIDTDRFRISVQKGPHTFRWGGLPESLPEPFRRTVVTVAEDREAARLAWKEGRLPEGFLVQQDVHLRIG